MFSHFPQSIAARATAFAATVFLAASATSAVASSLNNDKAYDLAGKTMIEYQCELGNTLTIYKDAKDGAQIGLRWKEKLYTLSRVSTTTGALRFENKADGLLWIGIPAKGMLLDSKQHRQLANECKSPDHLKAAANTVRVNRG